MNAAVKTLENLDVNKPQFKLVPESLYKNDSVQSTSDPELERQLRVYAKAELNYNNPRGGLETIFIGFINLF